MSALPPEDGERADLADWLQGHSGGGSFAGEAEYRKLRQCVTLLRQPPPPPAAGVSKEAVLGIIRGRYDGMTREDWDVVIAAIEALPEAAPREGPKRYMAVCEHCGKDFPSDEPGASWVNVPFSDVSSEELGDRCADCTHKLGPLVPLYGRYVEGIAYGRNQEVAAAAPPSGVDREAVEIRDGWAGAGRRGVRLGPDVEAGGLKWTPVLWDDEEDPDFHKATAIRALPEAKLVNT